MESEAMVPAGNNHVQHLPPPAAGVVHTTGVGGSSLERRAELATAAVAAAAKAETEARYAIALARPRDMNTVNIRLLNECQRPGFCEVARYAKPIGSELNENSGKWEKKFAEGFSIRFAEAAARCLGNIHIATTVLHDDDRTRILQITVTDLESNMTASAPVYVAKVVERKKLKKSQQAISQRLNSYGQTTYLIEATEDEMLVKAAALSAKARRNLILGLVPGDILDDCRRQIEATLADPSKVDPKERIKKILVKFAELAILPKDLTEYLGHDIAQASAAQVDELRGIWVALRDGDTSWRDVLDSKEIVEAEAKPAAAPDAVTTSAAAPAATAPAKTTGDLKAREKAKRQAAQPAAALPATAPAEPSAPPVAAAQPAAAPAPAPTAASAQEKPAIKVRGHEGNVVARGNPELPWSAEPPRERVPGEDDE